MKRTVHSGSDSMSWGKSKLSSYGAEQARPNMNKPDVAREKGKVGGNSPLVSTASKAGKLRTAS